MRRPAIPGITWKGIDKPSGAQEKRDPQTRRQKRRRSKSIIMLRDLVIVFALFSAAFVLAMVLDLHTSFEEASLQLRDSPFQYDELIVALAILATALCAFAVRRWRELQTEMDERVGAEEALRDSEERYRTLAEAAQDFIFIIDRDGRVQFVNNYAAEQLGSTPGEIVGRPASEALPHGMIEHQNRDLDEVFREGYPLHVEHKATFLGRDSWQSTSLVPIREADGSFHEVLGISRDITKRKKAEEALRHTTAGLEAAVAERTDELKHVNERLRRELDDRKAAEERLYAVNRALRTAMASSHALVGATDTGELLGAICRAVVETGGYRFAWVGFAEQGEGKPVKIAASAGHGAGYLRKLEVNWDADSELGRGPTGVAIRTGRAAIVRDTLADPSFAPWREEAASGGFASCVALPLVSDGRTFGALNILAGEPDAFGAEEVALLTGLAGDLAFGISAMQTRSERDSQAVELRRRGEQISLLVESLPIILYTSAAEGDFGVTYVSHNVTTITGFQPADLTADTAFWSEHIHPEDAAHVFDKLPRLFDKGFHEYEYRWRTADGSYRWFLDIMRLVTNPSDGSHYIVGMWLDITTRKQSEDSLRQMKDDLQSQVSERTTRLNEMNVQLRSRSEQLEHREHDARTLQAMDEMLQSCLTPDEAYSVFAETATELFPHHSGSLYVYNPSVHKYEAVSNWGEIVPGVPVFDRADCWSLRQGQLHATGGEGKGVRCNHVDARTAYICAPLRAAGITLGVLHIEPQEGQPVTGPAGEELRRLAQGMAEHFGLALYNLKLREMLEAMSVRDPFSPPQHN